MERVELVPTQALKLEAQATTVQVELVDRRQVVRVEMVPNGMPHTVLVAVAVEERTEVVQMVAMVETTAQEAVELDKTYQEAMERRVSLLLLTRQQSRRMATS